MALLQKLGASSRLLRSSPTQLTSSRGFAGGAADAHGSSKVPMWNTPTSPSMWKEEHISRSFPFECLIKAAVVCFEGEPSVQAIAFRRFGHTRRGSQCCVYVSFG